jgi:lysozyme family protein
MTASNYAACEHFTLGQEGGNSNVRGDRGGRTGRGGITHATYDAYRERKGLPLQDVFKISSAEIADIYRTEYWMPVDGDNLPIGVDLCVFDIAINSGPARARHIWQQATKTKSRANQIHEICADRLAFLQGLQSWHQFGRGWSRRVSECEAAAMHMVAAIDPATKEHIDKSKAAKAVKKSQATLGWSAFASVIAAILHFVAEMPPGVLVAVLAVAAVVVIHSFAKAKDAVAKVKPSTTLAYSTPVKVPPTPPPPPPGMIVTAAGIAVPQWPPMTSTPAIPPPVAEVHLSNIDIAAIAAAVARLNAPGVAEHVRELTAVEHVREPPVSISPQTVSISPQNS